MEDKIRSAALVALKLSDGDHIAAQKLMIAAMESAGLIAVEEPPRISAKPLGKERCEPARPGRFPKGTTPPTRCCPDCRLLYVREAFITKSGTYRAHCPDCRRRRKREAYRERGKQMEQARATVMKTFEEYQKDAAKQREHYRRAKVVALLAEAKEEACPV